jgi:hypothetical protein
MSINGVTVDLREARSIIPDLRDGLDLAVKNATDRTVVIMRGEVPGGADSLLGKGIRPEHDAGGAYPLEGRVTASAEVKKEARTALLHLPGGGTKEVNLRATEFDYAEVADEGSGLEGPRGQIIRPKSGRALLIGVTDAPEGESYIEDDKEKFILRPESKGQPPSHYSEKAAARLDGEADAIVADALAESGVIS